MKLRIDLFDRGGRHVETQTLPVKEALQLVKRFIVLHGTDPETGGNEGQPGYITFAPVREEQ